MPHPNENRPTKKRYEALENVCTFHLTDVDGLNVDRGRQVIDAARHSSALQGKGLQVIADAVYAATRFG